MKCVLTAGGARGLVEIGLVRVGHSPFPYKGFEDIAHFRVTIGIGFRNGAWRGSRLGVKDIATEQSPTHSRSIYTEGRIVFVTNAEYPVLVKGSGHLRPIVATRRIIRLGSGVDPTSIGGYLVCTT